MMIVLVSNMVFVMIAVWVLARLFKSEEILFGTGKGFTFLEKRFNIKKGTMPSMSDGIIIYALMMLIFVYIGSYLQVKYQLVGLVFSQLLFVLIPALLCIYIKTDWKKVYSIKKPKIMDTIGGILLWFGTAIIGIIIVNIIVTYFPQSIKGMEELEEFLFSGNNLWINLLIVAVCPAICEEIFFRGFLLSAFVEEKHPVRGIIITGLLFAVMHMSLIKMIPIFLLGVVIAYTVYKTKSIFIGMLIHFMNNGLSVLTSQNMDSVGQHTVSLENTNMNISILFLLGVLLVAVVSIVIGYIVLNRNRITK